VVDSMVADGALLRSGHRVRLPEGRPSLDPIMRERVDQLLATLASGGATPAPAAAVATRLGIPPALVDQLRAAGELISVAPRIDYPRDEWLEISRRLDRLATDGPLTVRIVRDDLDTARRFAEAILQHWNRLRTRR
jgi:hypothetical protein